MDGVAVTYTEHENPGKFWDTLALFDSDGQTIGLLYTTCAHHANELIPNETARLREEQGVEVKTWMHFARSQGGASCDVCFQLSRRYPDPNKPISRISRSGGTL